MSEKSVVNVQYFISSDKRDNQVKCITCKSSQIRPEVNYPPVFAEIEEETRTDKGRLYK